MSVVIGILMILFWIMTALAFVASIIVAIVLYITKQKQQDAMHNQQDFDWKSKDIPNTNIEK